MQDSLIYISDNTLTLSSKHAEPQVKKHLTAEEHAMRRAEMARRRKNLSEKRNEEEKVSPPLPFFIYSQGRYPKEYN